jgi:acyl-CoA reductase-like NAD-dependent aldehyde dehydrogenase
MSGPNVLTLDPGPSPLTGCASPADTKSGIGRETHEMMLDNYQQTKNLLVSYSPRPLGFF